MPTKPSQPVAAIWAEAPSFVMQSTEMTQSVDEMMPSSDVLIAVRTPERLRTSADGDLPPQPCYRPMGLWPGCSSMDVAGYVLHEAYRIDPLSPLSVLLVGYHHFFSGRFDQAADFQERSLQLDPEVMMAVWTAVRTFIAAGKHHGARECADYLRTRYPDSPYSESADLFVNGLNGRMKDMPAKPVASHAREPQLRGISMYFRRLRFRRR